MTHQKGLLILDWVISRNHPGFESQPQGYTRGDGYLMGGWKQKVRFGKLALLVFQADKKRNNVLIWLQ